MYTSGIPNSKDLDKEALTWFLNLEEDQHLSLETMERDFPEAFSKIGINYNNLALIYSFKQEAFKMIKRCSIY